jgi:hypothetical protein
MLTPKLLIIIFTLILITFGVIIWANTTEINLTKKMKQQQINSFADCASAGYPIVQSDPRTCVVPKGPSFTEADFATPSGEENICTNRCGDGVCQQVVCEGTGCTCAESSSICPQDCK